MCGLIPGPWDHGLSRRQWLNQLSTSPRRPKPSSFDSMRACGQERILGKFSVQKDGFMKHEDGTCDRKSCPGGCEEETVMLFYVGGAERKEISKGIFCKT